MYDVSPKHTQYFSFDNLDLLQELVYETFVDKTTSIIGLEQFAKPHSYNYAFDALVDLERVSMLLNNFKL